MPMCRVFSCVIERRCLLWPVDSLGKTLLAFALVHFVLQGQTCLLFQVSLDFLLFAFQSRMMKRTSFFGVSSRRSRRSPSVQFSSVMSDSLQPHGPQHAKPPCPSPTPRVYPSSCLSSQWCHPTISSSVTPFSSLPQSFPASGCFQMSQLFTSGGQNIGVSVSTSILPMNTQDWSPLGWTGWTSLQSKGVSRVFSNTTIQKHQFFGAQLSRSSYRTIQLQLLQH